MATLNAMYKREHRQNKFMAMLQGVDIENEKNTEGDGETVTFEEIKARAVKRMTGSEELANAQLYGFSEEENGTEYTLIR